MTTIPSQLGSYTIERELGRGGMGVVFLGMDTKLDRPVAIKALPEHLAGDPERMTRFQREAKLLASLTHPNIAGVYGLEEHDGAHYLVMEFVEGETLAQIISRGPLAVEETIGIGAQIAAGVEAAHEAGVIHRDLKPGNIVVTPQGKAKVLDFGLAKEIEGRGTSLDLSHAPTATLPTPRSPATAQGQIMGTAAYLSPEQARGKQLDKRTDIWSFGCVLFEMLTSISPFAGETSTDSFGAILHKEPEWSRLPPNTPAIIQLLLKRTLVKDPDRRLRDIGDARVELQEALLDPSATSLRLAGVALETVAPRKPRRVAVIVAFVIGAVLAGAGMYAILPLLTPRPELEPLRRVSLSLGEGTTVPPSFFTSLAISGDGSHVVFRGSLDNGGVQLFLRSFDQRTEVALPGTENATNPVFSPDEQWIAFEQDDKLRRMSIRGGPATTLCDVETITGVNWTVDGRIIFGNFDTGSLYAVGENGGEPTLLVERPEDMKQSFCIGPFALPGRSIMYVFRETVGETGSLYVRRPGASESSLLLPNVSSAFYSSSGHLLFRRDQTLMGVAFDASSLELLGQPVPIMEGVRMAAISGTTHACIASNGTFCFLEGAGENNFDLLPYAVDQTGQREAFSTRPRLFTEVSASPDGLSLALTVRIAEDQFDGSIWILDIARDLLTLLSPDLGAQSYPIWSNDGQWVYYSEFEPSESGGSFRGIVRRRSDGAGAAELIYVSDRASVVHAVLDNGNLLIDDNEGDSTRAANNDLAVVDLSGEEPVRKPWLETPADEEDAKLSPDGRWVAYNSDESGQEEIYIRALDGSGGRVQVSRDGGSDPFWAPDGRTIYFVEGEIGAVNRVMMTAAIKSELSPEGTMATEALQIGVPKALFEIPQGTNPEMAMMPDGRFVMNAASETPESNTSEIRVIFNFFQELERLAPTGSK